MTLSSVRMDALLDMCFQLGELGLDGFSMMWYGIRTKNWKYTRQEALASRWARQTPQRALEVATMLEVNSYPTWMEGINEPLKGDNSVGETDESEVGGHDLPL